MSPRAVLVGLLACLASVATTAKASVIFSDLGSGYDCCTAYGVTGPSSMFGKAVFAAQFTAPAKDIISEIDVAVIAFGGEDAVDLALYSDSGGALGSVLAVTQLTGLVPFGSTTATVAWTPVGVRVAAGADYWLFASAPNDAIDLWNLNLVGASGPVFGTGYPGYAVDTLPAFAVLGGGAPMPEPAAWILAVLGIGLAGAQLRLRQGALAAAI
jgi:hypothetical protein